MKLNNLAFVLFALCGFSASVAAADSGLPSLSAENSEQTAPNDEEPIGDEAEGALFEEEDDLSLRAVTCSTHKYNTAGCIRCTGSGEVRIVIDCKAPQITDYKSPYAWFNGSTKICGECKYGINSVSYQAR